MAVTCRACREECQVVEIDLGIGAYEYWGATGVDSHVVRASNCCEADFDVEEFPDDEDDCPF